MMLGEPQELTIRLPNDWSPRPYQRKVWDYLESGGRRAICVWHRRSGKDSTAVNWTACAALQRPGLYFHMAPQASQIRKVIWDALDGAGKRVIDQAFPKPLRESSHDNEMRIKLANGSVWQCVGSDNYDSLVGTNPVGIVFSEFALSDPQSWQLMRPILAENGGWALFVSTPRGMNHFYDLYEAAKTAPGWFCETLTVDDTGAVTKERIAEDRATGMSEATAKQEYWCSFAGAVEGAYYAAELETATNEKRIGNVPWEPALAVNTSWDFGLDDATAIWFWQRAHQEIRIIDYYEASGAGLDHYVKELDRKPYAYGEHFLPHDVEVRELGSGRSRLQMLRSLGLEARVVPRLSVEDGIAAVRSILGRCWFDETKCQRGLKALRAYRCEFDS